LTQYIQSEFVAWLELTPRDRLEVATGPRLAGQVRKLLSDARLHALRLARLSWTRGWRASAAWTGVILAAGAPLVLGEFDEATCLMLTPAIMAPAFLSSRRVTALAAGLAILGMNWIHPYTSPGAAWIDVAAFAVVAAVMAQSGRLLQARSLRSAMAEGRAGALERQLEQVWRLNALGEMAATLAHELNQPLSAAAGYLHASRCDLDRFGPSAQDALRTMDLASGQIQRTGQIIRSIRGLLEAGGEGLRPERVCSMIEDLTPFLELLGRDAGMIIRTQIDAGGDRVMADRVQFQQAVINLVRNAVEAVAERPARDVVIIGGPLNAGRYEISVEDNGPGVTADQADYIFQPLVTTKAAGMGLGLMVTRNIVESHGGEIAVGRSRLGGAAFQFSLNRTSDLGFPS
jgi:signal transduction histidine kinase